MYPPRDDYPGACWLITNRGIAKRVVFETRQDVERFQEALAVVVELGILRVHAFVFMTNHFHLLVTSPTGEISRAVGLVTNAFVRWFNRARRRDGPLFARRFHGRLLEDGAHVAAALRYIDLNPVRARMFRLPSEHPYGSARLFRFGGEPAWLAGDLVRRLIADAFAPQTWSRERYDEYACAADPEAMAYMMERALSRPAAAAAPLVDLVRAAGLRQQGWMEWKAALADGQAVGTAFLHPEGALRAARAAGRVLRRQPLPAGRATTNRDVAAGLLRAAAGRNVREVSEDLGISRSTAHAAIRRHELWMATSPRYSDVVSRALQNAVRRAFPGPAHPLALRPRVGSGGERRG